MTTDPTASLHSDECRSFADGHWECPAPHAKTQCEGVDEADQLANLIDRHKPVTNGAGWPIGCQCREVIGFPAGQTWADHLAEELARVPQDAVRAVLREHWPESGGQSGHRQALAAQDACADAILRVIPPGMRLTAYNEADEAQVAELNATLAPWMEAP